MADRSEWKQEAQSKAAEFAADAQDTIYREATHRAEQAKSGAAKKVQDAADAASAAAAQFNPNTFQAEAVRRVAEGIEGVANQIRTSDLDTIVREVSGFARRNPLLYIGAAAVVGFAATRFLKATSPDQARAGDPWSSSNTTYASTEPFDDHGSVLSKLNGGRHAG